MSKFKIGDKVKILDGSKINDYRGSWVQGMKPLIGHTAMITRVIEPFPGSPYAYKLDVSGWTFDERGLEAVTETKFKVGDTVRAKKNNGYKITNNGWCGVVERVYTGGNYIDVRGEGINGRVETFSCLRNEGFELVDFPKIVITTDGKRTRAAKYENDKKTVETIPKCSPDDTFDFMTGAKLAFERLIDEESGRDLRELLKTGVFGKMKKHGYFVIANKSIIYENGGFDRIDQFNKNLRSYIGDNLYDEVVEIYDGVNSFNNAKDSFPPPPTIWKR